MGESLPLWASLENVLPANLLYSHRAAYPRQMCDTADTIRFPVVISRIVRDCADFLVSKARKKLFCFRLPDRLKLMPPSLRICLKFLCEFFLCVVNFGSETFPAAILDVARAISSLEES